MKALKALGLAAALALAVADVAEAGPMPVGTVANVAAAPAAGVDKIVLVCGPYRCFRRFGWRYGYGYGYRPFGFGYRRFGYGPFGYRRFGWRRF